MMRDTEDVCTFMALLKSDVNFVAVRKMSVADDITLTRSFTFHLASAFSLWILCICEDGCLLGLHHHFALADSIVIVFCPVQLLAYCYLSLSFGFA